MNEKTICERAVDVVSYLYGETDERETRDVELHLRECRSCQAEAASFGQVRESVVAWRDEVLTGFIPSTVALHDKRSALAAFRQLARMPWSDDDTGGAPSMRALAKGENAVIREVASLLGNTPAVCRSSYIDPAVLAGWRDGSLQRAAGGATGERQWEQAALRFLKSARRRK